MGYNKHNNRFLRKKIIKRIRNSILKQFNKYFLFIFLVENSIIPLNNINIKTVE